MKIYLMCDLEGVSGIFSDTLQCQPDSPKHDEARALLTGEVNAAVEGLLAGGAKSILVNDGHFGGRISNLFVDQLNPAVDVLSGERIDELSQLDESFDALAVVGTHAPAGSPKGCLSHTFDPGHILRMWVNGVVVGEAALYTLYAGHFGVPTILVTGDHWALVEQESIIGGAECVAVKRGVSRLAAVHVAPARARRMICEGARRAMARQSSIAPAVVDTPVEIRVEGSDTIKTERAARKLSAIRINESTVAFRGEDLAAAWRAYKF